MCLVPQVLYIPLYNHLVAPCNIINETHTIYPSSQAAVPALSARGQAILAGVAAYPCGGATHANAGSRSESVPTATTLSTNLI